MSAIQHRGIVERIDGNRVFVKVERGTACQSCHAKGLCGEQGSERIIEVSTPYASSFAGYKDWFIQNFRRPGYTIEVGSGTNPLPLSQFEEIYRDNLPILITAAMEAPNIDNEDENE